MKFLAISWVKVKLIRFQWVIVTFCLLAAMVCPLQSLANDAVIQNFEVEQPRTFGYQLGDKLERGVKFRLQKPYQLLTDSLPLPGRLNQWIAFDSYELKQFDQGAHTQYELRLRYQVIGTNKELSSIGVPDHNLKISDGIDQLNFLVRASRTTISGLTNPKDQTLLPDIPPAVQSGQYSRVIWLALIFIGALIGLSVLHWGLPTSATRKPFTNIYQHVRKLKAGPWTNESYAETLHAIHQAFNQSAGKTVFADSLEEFFEANPRYTSMAAPIQQYFSHSNEYFFGNGEARKFLYSKSEITAFVQQCSDIERGLT